MLSKPKHSFSPVGCTDKTNQAQLRQKILGHQVGGGGGILFLVNRNSTWCAAVVKERGGQYAGKYNFPCGKHEIPNGQVIVTMQEEGHQELTFHIDNTMDPVSCNRVLGKTALIQIGTGKGTVVACVLINKDFSRATVNQHIAANNADPNLHHSYQEIEKMELVPVSHILACKRDDNHYLVDNLTDANGTTRQIEVTSFLIAVVHEFHKIGAF